MKRPPLPDFDADTGGNRYRWIIEQSKVVRAERQAVANIRQIFCKTDREAMVSHDAEVESDDAMRIRRLRQKYNPDRRKATK